MYGDDATNGFRLDDSVAETKLADVETFVYGRRLRKIAVCTTERVTSASNALSVSSLYTGRTRQRCRPPLNYSSWSRPADLRHTLYRTTKWGFTEFEDSGTSLGVGGVGDERTGNMLHSDGVG